MRDGDWCSRSGGEMPVHTKKIEPELLRLMACHPVMVHTLSCAIRSKLLAGDAVGYRIHPLFCRTRQRRRRIGGKT